MQSTTGTFRRELLPCPRVFYQRELGRLSRPSRGWARGNCPFHPSKSKVSFSVNLDTGGFYCHGCQVHGGDVVAFMRQRYKLDFKTAAMQLGAWDDTTTTIASRIRRAQREHERRQAKEEAEREAEREARIEARDCLHGLERAYRTINARLMGLHRGAAEKFHDETEYCWRMLSMLLPNIRRAEREYFLLAGVGDGQ